ncbi:MAG TPA: PTS sugar transporter subunit IIA [Candidatus Kryptonia bacterium]|nr:PTS sugar transporter subunit IIA [Candidatus Kryptonia bacterium]
MGPRLTEGLTLGAVVVRPPWHDFEETVRGLVHALAAAGHLGSGGEEPAVRAVLEREAMASTALVEIGVSMPHARVAGLDGAVAALAVSPTAVYYVSAETPITIVALLLSPISASGPHLNYLSSLSMLLQSERTRDRLQTATTADDVYDVLRGQWR